MKLLSGLTAAFILFTFGMAFAQQPEKFDYNPVRDDFFASFQGEPERLEKALTACEKALKADPKNPMALVWHGCCTAQKGVNLIRSGQYPEGRALWQKGLAEMDEAVKLRPKDIGILIPRGSYLLPAARYSQNPDEVKRLLARVVSDYEIAYATQKPQWHKLGQHSQGELLLGLAETYIRLNQREKARPYLETVQRDLKGTGWAKDAGIFLALKSEDKTPTRACIGCHE